MKTVLFSLLFTLNVTYAAKKGDKVVAEVNGTKIFASELDMAIKQSQLVASGRPVTKEIILNDLINRAIGINRAYKNKLHKNDTVKAKMEDVLYHAQISKDLEGQLKKLRVSDSEVLDYYKDNREYRTKHILLRVQVTADENEIKAAQDQAFKIYAQLKKNPSKFEELAKTASQSSTAPLGGDLGYQPAALLAPEYYAAIKGQSKGSILPPVRTKFGYHIVKVLDFKKPKDIQMELYKKLLYDKKRDALIAKYFSQLRKKASVKINQQALR